MKGPFNLRLPDGVLNVEDKTGRHIGYVWRLQAPLRRVDNSVAKTAEQLSRFGSMTLDGVVISRNSRTYKEAVKTLRAGIARKINADPLTSRARKNTR
jgi:hypothetical protein